MRSTLFYIPHEILGLPLFGFGWALLLLAIGLIAWGAWQFRQGRSTSEVLAPLPFWALTAAVIIWVLPGIEARWPDDGTPIGLPIRGYGIMVLSGLLAGIALCSWRGKQLGIDADTIIGLGFWMMLGGVLGARTFYVVQKWEEFDQLGWMNRLVAIVKLTEGGLVIYGGVFGGLAAGIWFCWRHKLHLLSVADLIAPGFLAGLALGRIGCLLHGCCFGGICTAELPTITFPPGSGPYEVQLGSGELLGLELGQRRLPTKIISVSEGSVAEQAEIKAGDRLLQMVFRPVAVSKGSDPTAQDRLLVELLVEKQETSEVIEVRLPPNELPPRSLPVHPSQLYAAVNAALLCWLIFVLQPLPKRDGMAFLTALLLYAVSRFTLEAIRSDEAGQLGTSFTISQLIAMATGAITIAGIAFLASKPPKRVWKWQAA